MLVNNDQKRYSYNNNNVVNKKFVHKNFNKTISYHSNFSHSEFINVSFIGTKFKFSSLFGSVFNNCYLRGALFKKCNLKNCIFRNCIIYSLLFENSKLENCNFENCKIYNSPPLQIICNKKDNNNEILDSYPKEDNFSNWLIAGITSLKENIFIRKSSILHLKKTTNWNDFIKSFSERIWWGILN